MSTLHVHTVIVRAVDVSRKASDLICNSVCDIDIYMLCMKLCVKYCAFQPTWKINLNTKSKNPL